MLDGSAAAENGYYFLTQSASETAKNVILYYYDMTIQTSVPLCSKINCAHNDFTCDAYFNESNCLGNMLWYCNKHLYMIERTDERDNLVSYDNEGKLYFLSWIRGDKATELKLEQNIYNGTYILNKYNLLTKEKKELCKYEDKDNEIVSINSVKLSYYDGKYLYLTDNLSLTVKIHTYVNLIIAFTHNN